MKIKNRKEFKNIAINHSADIDSKDFMKIYRECTKEPYSVLTTDTVTCKRSLKFQKKKQKSEAQYDLDRKTAKISTYFSNDLDKYEYLTGEDLYLKPSLLEQARFEYSLLGKIFNKGITEEDKQKVQLQWTPGI